MHNAHIRADIYPHIVTDFSIESRHDDLFCGSVDAHVIPIDDSNFSCSVAADVSPLNIRKNRCSFGNRYVLQINIFPCSK